MPPAVNARAGAPARTPGAVAEDPAALRGLTALEVADRVRSGEVNAPIASGRRYRDIVRDNVITPVNAILAGLLALSLFIGPLQDATFGGILVLNVTISLVQELRAKQTLDRLAIVAATQARVVRDGQSIMVPASQVVLDDLVELTRGDQAVADMRVLAASGLEADESLITGESRPVLKHAGELVAAGSSVVAGSGRCRVSAVSDRCFAGSVVAQARRHHLMGSALRSDLNRLLFWLLWVVVPTAVLLVLSELQTRESLSEALRGAVAGTVAMVPEGLILLTSMTFAVGVLRLSRRHVLVQELPAMEMLARADVLCIDKTGTITEPAMAVSGVQLSEDAKATVVAQAMGALCWLEQRPNSTMQALQRHFPGPPPGWADEAVPFSSQRGWSAIHRAAGEWWILGGPDVIKDLADLAPETSEHLTERMSRGERVLILASTGQALAGGVLPADLRVEAEIGLTQPVRAGVEATLKYFADEGVVVRVLSGDNPMTVAAVAQAAGLSGAAAADARALPDDDRGALGEAIEASTTWGRVRPEQKQMIVEALRARGHTVAMLGDGVNDILAMRAADIGIAMGTGSAAARAASRAILLDDDFEHLPSVVAEGRRLIGNVERVSKLFLTKTAYAVLIALLVAALGLPFPFWSRHLTLVAGLTVGIPGFILALTPNTNRVHPRALPRVLRFAIPAGVIAGAATLVGYHLVDGRPSVPFGEAQTVATLTLIGVGLWVVSALQRPLARHAAALIAAMVAALFVVIAVPFGRAYFALDIPATSLCFAILGVVAVAGVVIEVLLRLHLLGRAAG